MKDIRLPWFMLSNFELVGAEDPPEGGDGTGEGGEGGEGGDGTDGGEGGEGGSNSGKEKETEDTAGLKSALDKERKANVAKDRELAKLKKAEQERADSEKTEVQRAKEDAEKATTKTARLATGFRNEKIDNAIRAAASKLSFHDADDAILAVDRDAIDWEQDDDDPSQVKVDKKTVDNAVKKLATSKPHLIKSGTSDSGPTGGQFGGGGRGGNNGEADEATYATRYPSL